MENENKVFNTKSEVFEDCQKTISSLPGVLNVRFSYSDNGDLTDIHVLSDITRSPKQVLRDIQSTMFAKYNLVLDRRIVSIAQLQSANTTRGSRSVRLICQRVDISSTKEEVTATVVLETGDEEFTGRAVYANTPYGRRRIVADATLNAVKEYLHDSNRFTVLDVKELETADLKVQVVLVSSNAVGNNEVLVGAAGDPKDSMYAVAKATLDAVNRKLQILS